MRNTHEAEEQMSPYMAKHGIAFEGMRLPFGVGVYYYLSPTKKRHSSKFEARLCYGILLGYSMDPGLKWSGMYIVGEPEGFVNKSLFHKVSHTEHQHMQRPHLVSSIAHPVR